MCCTPCTSLLCQLFPQHSLCALRLLHFHSSSGVWFWVISESFRKWRLCLNCCCWLDFRWVVEALCILRFWFKYLTPFFSFLQNLDLVRSWSRGPWPFCVSSSFLGIPLTSLQPDSREASSWEGLDGTSSLQTQRRVLTNATLGEEPTTTAREKSPELPAALFTMATNREHQLRHMTGFPRAMYPFTFNSMRSHSPFDLLASSHLFGRFGADLPKEMAALCE